MSCLGFGCTGCHFSYLLYFFIFQYISQFYKIYANRHQTRATGQKSGIFLLAGVGGRWCQMRCHWCHLLDLFLLFGDFLRSLCHYARGCRFESSGNLSHKWRICQAGRESVGAVVDAEPMRTDAGRLSGCRCVRRGGRQGWGLVFLPRGAQKSEMCDGGGVGTIPCTELLIS